MSQTVYSSEIQFAKYKGLSVQGYSRAAHRTGLKVHGLPILLDAGLDVQECFSHIFITHAHLDHVIFLPQYTMNNENEKTINVISTAKILDSVKEYVSSALRMSQCIASNVTSNEIMAKAFVQMKPISSQTLYEFIHGNDKWLVKSVRCFHGIDSIGFGFSVEKTKLKEEYKDLKGNDIKKLKNDGVEITYKKIEQVFLFLGDTNKRVLEDRTIYEYPTIIMECTYIYHDEISLAKKNHHIHWEEIKDIVKENSSIQFILIHFSMKYKKDEITEFFAKENVHNVNILL